MAEFVAGCHQLKRLAKIFNVDGAQRIVVDIPVNGITTVYIRKMATKEELSDFNAWLEECKPDIVVEDQR